MRLAFIGFGNAAFDIALGLHQQGLSNISFYKHHDKPPFSRLLAQRAAQVDAEYKAGYQALLADSFTVISCVVGRATVDVAQQAAPYLTARHLYIDMNTASSEAKQQAERLVQASGALYADAAIMGPVEAFRHAVPIVVSGLGAQPFHDLFTPYGMDITVLEGGAGNASSVKLLRSIFQKGLAALLLETLTASRAFGVQETVLQSLSKTLDNVPLSTTATRLITKGLVNAKRMSQELEDVLHALVQARLPHAMTQGALDTYRHAAELSGKECTATAPPRTLDEALALMTPISKSSVPTCRTGNDHT